MGLYVAIPLVLLIIVLLWIVPVGLWLQAIFSIGGGHVTIFNLIGMRFRRVPPSVIVNGLIASRKAGIPLKSDDLEVHYMAGGDVDKVVDALIAASKAGIELTFEIATAIDLAGRDVLSAVQTSVYPKVIDAPVDGKLSAVSKDGIEVRARARVTVRTDIPNLVGGATEDTIIARVDEGIVSAIGSKESYEAVLENPDSISKNVLDKGLNHGTAFEILSIDIETFGGRVDAATQVKDAISSTDIQTIAFINRRAISAGSLISLSCNKIYMTSGATIGATSVVDMSGEKQAEKSQSYMREEMAATAEQSGKNTTIARGMVDEELSFEYLVVDGDSMKVDDIEGRKEGKLITLTTELALKYKIADGTSESIEDILLDLSIENYDIITLDENWSEDLVRILTDPVVSSLLTTFGTIGIISELYSAGWGIGGTIGIICLTLALGAGYLTKLASATDLLIIFSGLTLLLVEFVAIPGFGVFGIIGLVILFYGLYLLLIPDVPVSDEIYSAALDGFAWAIGGGVIVLIMLIRLISQSKMFQKLITKDSNKATLKDNYDKRSKV
jgi:membrane-bound serine protease (ClpP class)